MSESTPRQFKRRFAMCVAIAMTIAYLLYRGLYTLNLAAPVGVALSLVLYVAECYGALLLFLFFFQIWDVRNPAAAPVRTGRTVDVLIPTYNEDPQLLRGTISAALRIAYPHRTLVLDDGRRPDVRALCEELGAEYITRPDNRHAKAGNLNHALAMTGGELVVIFDADHVAERHFIDRLVGYFDDDRMGFVQTPHAFYNFDAFQGVLNYERGEYWEEGMLFYNVTQPGKNRWNGVSFCGSAAMFSRKALEDVGLVATESITEDMLTGLRMHAKGWKSLFVNERLVAAMAAEDITTFNTQRLRWGEGNLGIFAIENPLTMRGLSLAQRLCYLGSMLSWTTGVQKLMIYCTPLLMLLCDVAPVNEMTWQLALLMAAYLAANWTGVKVASNGYGWLLAIELTQMTSFWLQVKATWRAIFGRRKARFIVTSKRGRQSPGILRHIAPQICYIASSAIAITWALTRYLLNISHDPVGLVVGSALVIINSCLAWVVIQRALQSKDRRSSWRHPVALHVDYCAQPSHGAPICGQCVTRDINEGGLGLVAFEQLPEKAVLDLTISAAGQSIGCRGVIRSRVASIQHDSMHGRGARAFVYGVEFLNPDKSQLEMLWWLGAQFAVGLNYERFAGGQFGLGSIQSRKLPVRAKELTFELPVTLDCGDTAPIEAVTESLGPDSLTLLLPERNLPATPLRLCMATPFGNVQASANVAEWKSRTLAGCQVRETRLQYAEMPADSRATLCQVLDQHESKELAPVIRSTPQRRPHESLRPAALVMGTTGIAAAIVLMCVWIFEQDDVVLARAESGRSVSAAQLKRLDAMVDRACADITGDEDLALRLRSAMVALRQKAEVQQLDRAFGGSSPRTIEGQALKAESLQNLNLPRQADDIYQKLLTELNRFYDDRGRWDVVLAAARNAANLGDLSTAISRYKLLGRYGMLTDEARLEYAGVLAKAGQTDEAARLLEQGSPTTADLRFLAEIYTSTSQFPKAVAVYRRLITHDSDDVWALEGIADNLLWSRDFAHAATAYRALLQHRPNDRSIRKALAESLLYDHRYQKAVNEFAELLKSDPSNSTLWDSFLMAAAGSPSLSPSELAILERIYRSRAQGAGDNFESDLANAVAKHGKPEHAVPLLEGLLKRAPDDARLRLRLADTLHNLGRYKEADVQFRWLLNHPQTYARVKLK